MAFSPSHTLVWEEVDSLAGRGGLLSVLPWGRWHRKKALDFGKGVGKKVLFP